VCWIASGCKCQLCKMVLAVKLCIIFIFCTTYVTTICDKMIYSASASACRLVLFSNGRGTCLCLAGPLGGVSIDQSAAALAEWLGAATTPKAGSIVRDRRISNVRLCCKMLASSCVSTTHVIVAMLRHGCQSLLFPAAQHTAFLLEGWEVVDLFHQMIGNSSVSFRMKCCNWSFLCYISLIDFVVSC